MNTEMLKELGLNDEQVKGVMAAYGKELNPLKEQVTSLTSERDSTKDQLKTVTGQLDQIQKDHKGDTDLQAEITKLKAANEQATKDAILPARKFGPANLTGFVSTTVMDALERSTEFTRNITNQNVGQTALESRVTSIDGVTLIEVWDDDRFKTAYDFSDGFAATADAAAIEILVVAKQAVVQAVKENAVYLFAPGEHTEGDGYLYQNRLYHDLWVLDQQKDGVIAVTAPKA